MRNHWVRHSIMKPIDVGELFNKNFIISELKFGLNEDDAIGTSVIVEDRT